MNPSGSLRNWIARILVMACLLAVAGPVTVAEDEAPAVPNSEIRGKVHGPDGRPAAGIEIFAYHLATEELFSAETDGKGEFLLADLPYGYFDLAARSVDGLYVADQVANVGPAGKNRVEFRLQGFSASTRAEQRAFPAFDEVPVGLARVVDQRMVGETFWRSPKGVSVIAGGGALVLLAIAGGSESPASPFTFN